MTEHDMLMLVIGILNLIVLGLVGYGLSNLVVQGKAITRVEGKVDSLNAVLATRVERADLEHQHFATREEVAALKERVDHMDERLDQINEKMDKMLLAVKR